MKKLLLFTGLFLILQNYGFSQGIKMFANNPFTITFGPTWTNWVEYPDSINMKPARNIGFDFAFLYAFKNKSGNLGVQAGLGMSMVNINTNVYPLGFDDNGAFKRFLKDGEYAKNKLALTYLEIPVEFVFKAKPESNKSFKFALGFKGGLTIDAHTKIKLDDGRIFKEKSFDNINRLRYGPTVRIGVGGVHLYGNYALTSTFEGEKIPDYNQYTVGIIFSNF